MKLAVTICDCGQVVHAGGEPNRETSIIQLRDDQIPAMLRDFVEEKNREREQAGQWCYKSATFSVVVDGANKIGGAE